jgi:hypothetical protein
MGGRLSRLWRRKDSSIEEELSSLEKLIVSTQEQIAPVHASRVRWTRMMLLIGVLFELILGVLFWLMAVKRQLMHSDPQQFAIAVATLLLFPLL